MILYFKWVCRVAVFVVLAGPALATLELPDQLNVGGGGLGPVVASFEAMTNEVGFVVDDTFDGEITFKWTMKWNVLEGGTAYQSWSIFQFFDDPGDEPPSLENESIGIGTEWASAQISTFREPGGYGFVRESGTTIQPGVEYDFTLVVDYHAGARDTAVISGGGFVNQPLASGDWSFHHLRARVGSDGQNRTRVDFTRMSISSTGIGGVRFEEVDPAFPADWHRRQQVSAAEGSRWPWRRIRQLAVERDRLRARISVLPQHDPVFLSTRLGYHSLFEESSTDGSLPPHQIDFTFRWSPVLDAIALAPAFNPKGPGAYAFPKRFKIEVLDAKTERFEEVVNWMAEDFPDPGPYPVFFAGINRAVRQVRITVPPGMQESGAAYFALGEVFLFQQALDGQLGDNMAVWGTTGIEVAASGSFALPPLWDLDYLYDGSVGFGFPLSDQTVAAADLMVTYDDDPSEPVQLTLDLGRQEKIGRIEFWPAGAPYLLALPSLGFPRKITMELSPDADFERVLVLETESASGHRENLLAVMAGAYEARYIRITMEGLGEYKGKKILGLGEISVSEYGKVLSANCTVTAKGIPAEYHDQLSRLVDGCSRQRLIMPEGEWVKGLAERRPLDRRLAVVEAELERAGEALQRTHLRMGIWGGGLVFAVLLGGLVVQQRMRKRGLQNLKWRITRDLHDEVGSSLGSISLAAKRLEKVPPADVAAGVSELSLLAREASVSLREVVWVTDRGTIRLPDLIQMLAERAERVLYGTHVSIEIPPACPDTVVPLTFKRHLIMFFREAVYNCARHAQATEATLTVSICDGQLSICFSDNGCGFDPATRRDGWGLDSMEKRGRELGGTTQITSQPGAGTTVQLTIPLKALLKKTDHLYKTSN